MKEYTASNLFTGEIIKCGSYSRNRARRQAIDMMKYSIDTDRRFGFGHPIYRQVYSQEKNVVYFKPIIREEYKT